MRTCRPPGGPRTRPTSTGGAERSLLAKCVSARAPQRPAPGSIPPCPSTEQRIAELVEGQRRGRRFDSHRLVERTHRQGDLHVGRLQAGLGIAGRLLELDRRDRPCAPSRSPHRPSSRLEISLTTSLQLLGLGRIDAQARGGFGRLVLDLRGVERTDQLLGDLGRVWLADEVVALGAVDRLDAHHRAFARQIVDIDAELSDDVGRGHRRDTA